MSLSWWAPIAAAVLILLLSGPALLVAYVGVIALRRTPDPRWSTTYEDLRDFRVCPAWVPRLVAKFFPARGFDEQWAPKPSSRQAFMQGRLAEIGAAFRARGGEDDVL